MLFATLALVSVLCGGPGVAVALARGRGDVAGLLGGGVALAVLFSTVGLGALAWRGAPAALGIAPVVWGGVGITALAVAFAVERGDGRRRAARARRPRRRRRDPGYEVCDDTPRRPRRPRR